MGTDYSRELIAASTIPLILAVLRGEDSYGYAIIKRVRTLSRETLEWTEGMLYPVLHRLEKQKLIESYWASEQGRRRRYYRLLPAGAAELQRLKAQWTSMHSTLNRSWGEL
ncbi:helix-turn-helix transcriptional regulator [bacterium]|nr:helix-turn-helix transcriptional regulator [bacterium]